jgi:hypothetical protein
MINFLSQLSETRLSHDKRVSSFGFLGRWAFDNFLPFKFLFNFWKSGYFFLSFRLIELKMPPRGIVTSAFLIIIFFPVVSRRVKTDVLIVLVNRLLRNLWIVVFSREAAVEAAVPERRALYFLLYRLVDLLSLFLTHNNILLKLVAAFWSQTWPWVVIFRNLCCLQVLLPILVFDRLMNLECVQFRAIILLDL